MSRFAALREDSPFILATKGPDVPPPGPLWSDNLYIGSVARYMQNGVEKDWVVVRDRAQPGTLFTLSGTDPNLDGFQLVKLIWSEDPKKTKADIKKGPDQATIAVDQAAYGPGTAPMGAPKMTNPGPKMPPPVPPGLPGANAVKRQRIQVIGGGASAPK